ncbi:MAG: anthranilate phosphoribosyltransferase [Thermomicrobiales bacterium]
MTSANTAFDIQDAIRTVVDGRELDQEQATAAMDAIMTGTVTGAQIGALVTGLRMKGETAAEIAGFARAMRDHALQVDIEHDAEPLLDTCGTGGDHSNTFNISTTATFAIAAAGVRIAKHGNRAASSLCGSADLLEGLGVNVELTPSQVEECVRRVGVGFMYAPAFHPAMRFVGPARKEMGIRTVFNILGPLANPAGTRHQLIGVGHPDIAAKMAEVLSLLGSSHAVLVHAEEGLDEVGIQGFSQITEWDERRGEIQTYRVQPEDFGLERGTKEDLLGGDAAANVAITRSILAGEQGPRRSITLMNAGAGIYAANAAESFAEGIAMAAEAIDSGRAAEKLEQLVSVTRELVAQPEEVRV